MSCASPLEFIVRAATNEHVAHLRMASAGQHLSVQDGSATNAGADRQITEPRTSLACAPAPFGQCSSVDVGIERDRDTVRSKRSDQIRALPRKFWCRPQSTPADGAWVGIDWPECRNSDC